MKLFSSTHPVNISEVIRVLPQVVNEEMNETLGAGIIGEEVYQALRQMHPSKGALMLSHFLAMFLSAFLASSWE